MIKQFSVIKVAQITTDETVEYFTLDGLFIGGYSNKGIIDKQEAGTDTPKFGGIVKPLSPQVLKIQQEHDTEKELSSLDVRLNKAGGKE